MANSIKNLKNNDVFKYVMVAFVALMMLIPLDLIKKTIDDRKDSMSAVLSDVNSTWGNSQVLSGPSLVYTWKAREKDSKSDESEVTRTHTVYPDVLNYEVEASTRKLHRSIYDVMVYTAEMHVSGSFVLPSNLSALRNASFRFGLNDLRGIEGDAVAIVDGQEYRFDANGKTGIGFNLPIPEDKAVAGATVPFDFKLRLRGSSELSFKPVADLTTVKLSSDCTTPSFCGDFLPFERDVREDGFNASWVVSQINRGEPESTSFGVRMLSPISQYQQTYRTSKYGLLIIMLIFLAALVAEFVTKKEISVVQYLVVGLSLALFYCLLLSFSEFLAFWLSYLLAALMTVTALTAYFRAILKDGSAYILGSFVVVSYLVCYVLMQMKTYALLTGSLILFAGLGIVMYLTRNLNKVKAPTEPENEL